MKKTFLLIFTLAFTAACNMPGVAPQPGIPTSPVLPTLEAQATSPVAPTVEAAQPTLEAPAATSQPAPLTPDGEIVSVGGVSFLLPNGMASDASSTMTGDVEFPYIYPMEQPMPQHMKFILNNYPVQGAMFEPQIMVFKAAEYAQYGTTESQLIAVLTNMHFTDDQPIPSGLPVGPSFSAQVHGLDFQNGKGIRYLTQFDQAPMPVNNNEMIYYFHGITNDGQYYVEAILPIQAPFLVADGNPDTALPADGIPFLIGDGIPGYFSAITERINSTDTFSFTPYLEHLDSMMQSFQVTGF